MMSSTEDSSHWVYVGNTTVVTMDYSPRNYTGYEDLTVYLNVIQVLFPMVYFIQAFVGIVGNALVLFIIAHPAHPDMKTVTNYFIVNLAITDIAALVICIIPTALYTAGVLPLERGACKAINYVQYVTVQATCCTLTAMSIDRYNLIVHAVRSRKNRTTTKVLIINVCIWIVSFTIHSPIAVYSEITHGGICETFFDTVRDERIFHTVATLTMYVLPLSINLVCYINILIQVWTRTARGTESAQAQERSVRRKRKITRMVFVVVLLFAICWGPTQVLRMWQAFDYVNFSWLRSRHYKLVGCIELIFLCLAYGNSCVNPFVYAFTTTSFKKYFKKVFRPCCRMTDNQFRSTSMNPSTSRLSKVITREESSV